MAVAIDEFVRAVETAAPPHLAESWDNTGLLLRCGDSVSSVLVALDATEAVAEEAQRKGCDMILTHHPLLMDPLKTFDCRVPADAVLMRLIRAGISLYAAHTSFDKTAGGINDALAQKLGLEDVVTAEDGLMRTGNLKQPCGGEAFLQLVKRSANAATLRISKRPDGNITRVALVGGSGGDYLFAAKNAGAQALLTGEAKHHHFIQAEALGIWLVCAGHFETECLFVERIFMSLQAWLNEVQLDLALEKSGCDRAPYTDV